ncbi:MAG TPA: FtsX-like permease family protein [Chitinophagaceae bacterium]
MKVAGFIADRVAFNQQKSFSRFIIRLSIVATVISVAVMIITLALANGFQDAVSQKVFSFWGHIRIQERQPDKSVLTEETPIIQNDSLTALIKQNPDVKTIHPFATKYAILKTTDEIEGVLVKGFDKTYDFNHFKPFIKEGRPIQFNDSTYSREIMISSNTANQLELKLNDRILIYFIRPDGSLRPDKLTISGIYKTGIEEYDKTFAIGDIKLIQKLNDWEPDEIGGYEVFLDDYKKMDKVAEEIFAIDEFPEIWETKTTKEISPNIFDWLNMQDVTRNVLIGFMIAIAVINLITCLIILVLERVQMIGILKSLGASNWTVQKIFLRHSLIITLTGIIIGAIIALGLLFLQKETGFIKLQEEAYYLSEAAVKIVWWQVGLICAGTLLICFLILMIPSILVRKIQPVKAIHFR